MKRRTGVLLLAALVLAGVGAGWYFTPYQYDLTPEDTGQWEVRWHRAERMDENTVIWTDFQGEPDGTEIAALTDLIASGRFQRGLGSVPATPEEGEWGEVRCTATQPDGSTQRLGFVLLLPQGAERASCYDDAGARWENAAPLADYLREICGVPEEESSGYAVTADRA